MSIKNLKNSVNRLQNNLISSLYYKDKDEKGLRLRNYASLAKSNLKFIEENFWKSSQEIKDVDERLEFSVLLHRLKITGDIKEILKISSEMEEILKETDSKKDLNFKIPRVHDDVKGELVADIEELKICYNAKCYRSCIIICGRLLEIGLHRKYFETTNRDILETNPGIGLGSLVAKLIEKEVKLDPGLTQQIRLINNVRIFSVHKKQRPFYPSKSQAHATILFTLDILEKLF